MTKWVEAIVISVTLANVCYARKPIPPVADQQPSSAAAKSGGQSLNLGECTRKSLEKFAPLHSSDKCFLMDTKDTKTQGLRQATAVSGDRVFVEIVSKPIEKCTISTKAEALPPETSPASFITSLTKLVVPAGVEVKVDACKNAADSDAPSSPKPAEVTAAEKQMAALNKNIDNLEDEIAALKQKYQDAGKVLVSLQDCKDISNKDICTVKETFQTAQASVLTIIDNALKARIATTIVAEAQAQKAQDSLKQISDPDWLANKSNQLSCYLGRIAAAKAVLGDLSTARQQFAKISDVVRSLTFQDLPKIQLTPSQKNAKATTTVTCSNLIGGDSIDPVTVIVSYKDIPLVTSTAGVLVTLTPKQVIGTTPVKTGTSSGVATFKTVFAVTDRVPAQAIPFSFINLRLHYWRLGSRLLTVSGSGGIGVNPNSGTKEVEFFTGTAFGVGNLYLHFGAHFGEFKNLGGGFAIGETVPSSFPSIVPINKGYTIHPSFAVTYRLPLP